MGDRPSWHEIEELFNDAVAESIENDGGVHAEYLEGVKDALGWALGYYDVPDLEKEN